MKYFYLLIFLGLFTNINLESVILYNASPRNIIWNTFKPGSRRPDVARLEEGELGFFPYNEAPAVERDAKVHDLLIFLDYDKNKVISDEDLFWALRRIEDSSEYESQKPKSEIGKLEDQIRGIKEKAKTDQLAILKPVVEKVLKNLELEKAKTERKKDN